MAASESEKSSPKISKLPLPISDSPLVIDLPDGQKIVVGKMTLGTVIEVATWRGVGRPDSRTSRLMLGMGSGNVNEESASDAGTQGEKRAPVKPKGFAGIVFTLQQLSKNFSRINWPATFSSLFGSLGTKKKKKSAQTETDRARTSVQPKSAIPDIKPEVTISRASEDADIEAWLDHITQKATRETTTKKAPAKSSGARATKAKPSVKKATPKTTNPRSSKKE